MTRSPAINVFLLGMGSVICLQPDLYPAARIHPLAKRFFIDETSGIPVTGDLEVDIEALRSDWQAVAQDFRQVYEQEVSKIKAAQK